MAAHPVRRCAAARPKALTPLHHTGHAHPEDRRRGAARTPAHHGRYNPLSQIL
jgi:hypothetical protein